MKNIPPDSVILTHPTFGNLCTKVKALQGNRLCAFNKLSRTRVLLLLPLAFVSGVLLQAVQSQAQTLSSISITPTAPSVGIGSTIQLTATAKYSSGSTTNVTDNVTWSSSDPRLIGVSSTGLVSGKATATLPITATYQGKTATTTITSSVGDITWSGPIVITAGGTYSGNWKSTSATTPAVKVETTAPVIIENSYVTGPNDLIWDETNGSNLTVKNTIGIGQLPNVKGQSSGLFVDAIKPATLTVEHCFFESVRFGVWVRGYAGNKNGTQTITILNNRGHNIVGTESNGSGGTLAGETNWQWAHGVQISNVYSVPGMQIAWNEVVNYPNESLTNEVINIYESSGTSSSPFEIHDNYIQGAYPYVPATDAYNAGGYTTDGSSSDTVATATAYNNVYNNQFVGLGNMGAEIGTGHDNFVYNNRAVSSGLLPNGQKMNSQNVGLTFYDVRGNVATGSMYNNNMYNNTVGWMCWKSSCSWDSYRNDDYFPLENSDYTSNTSLPAGTITLATEQNEYTIWLNKLSSDSEVVGPTFAATNSGSGSGGGSGSSGTISTTAWYSIENTNSTLCVDALASGTANNTKLVQDTCNSSSTSQQWQFQSTGSGYYQVVNRNALNATAKNEVWDVLGGPRATAIEVPIQLYSWKTETNEEWLPTVMSNDDWTFTVRNSSMCLDVPGASSEVNLELQQYTCNKTGAQTFTLKAH